MILMACGARHTTAPQFQLSAKPFKVYRATMRPNQQKILLDTDDMLTCSVHAITLSCVCIGIIAVWIYRLCPASSRLHWQKLFKRTQHTDKLSSDICEQYAWGPESASDSC